MFLFLAAPIAEVAWIYHAFSDRYSVFAAVTFLKPNWVSQEEF